MLKVTVHIVHLSNKFVLCMYIISITYMYSNCLFQLPVCTVRNTVYYMYTDLQYINKPCTNPAVFN